MTEAKRYQPIFGTKYVVGDWLSYFQSPEARKFLQRFTIGEKPQVIYGSLPVMAQRSSLMKYILDESKEKDMFSTLATNLPHVEGDINLAHIWLWMNGVKHNIPTTYTCDKCVGENKEDWPIDPFTFFFWIQYFEIHDSELHDVLDKALAQYVKDNTNEETKMPKVPSHEVALYNDLVTSINEFRSPVKPESPKNAVVTIPALT